MNRKQLWGGVPLEHDCFLARTIRETNGDVICGGLHQDNSEWFLGTATVIKKCRTCRAWHENWMEAVEAKKESEEKGK